MSAGTSLSGLTRAILGFVALNALLGALVLIFFPASTETLFFWTIKPPINAALFGALYLGGAVVVGWMTFRGTWETARFLIPVLVAAGFFISVTTFIHIDRFEQGIKLIYWLVIYIGAPLLAIGLYIYYERRGADWTIHNALTPATRNLALITGAIVMLAGIVMFFLADSVIPYWAWSISPLMLRIFIAWFCAFGIGLLWFRVDGDWNRLHYMAKLMIAASALDLLMIFLHRADWSSNGISIWGYCFHLALFGVIGGLMHWLQARARK